jgi:amidophosphoribosyltransferase
MAAQLGATSLRYLPVEAIARAIGLDPGELCRACITGEYPTPCGAQLAAQAADDFRRGECRGRTYDPPGNGEGRSHAGRDQTETWETAGAR